jgi:hypothetical protein
MGEWKQVLVSFKRWVKALFAEISAAFSEEEPPRQSPPGKGTVPNVETSPFLNCGDLAPIIESLTAPRYWDFSRFRRVLIALATAG